MRRKLPPAPLEMPARLRVFDPAEWGTDPGASKVEPGEARGRWLDARTEWGRVNGLTPLDVLRQGLNDRRRAGVLPPIDYDDNQPRRNRDRPPPTRHR